jgi:hypothetical protein
LLQKKIYFSPITNEILILLVDSAAVLIPFRSGIILNFVSKNPRYENIKNRLVVLLKYKKIQQSKIKLLKKERKNAICCKHIGTLILLILFVAFIISCIDFEKN